MKHFSAIITSLLITTVIGLGIFVIGINAITNTNTVPLKNSPNSIVAGNEIAQANGSVDAGSIPSSTMIQELNRQVSDLQAQLNQAGQAIQQYQSLIIALQQRGVISIDRNGDIYLPEGNNN